MAGWLRMPLRRLLLAVTAALAAFGLAFGAGRAAQPDAEPVTVDRSAFPLDRRAQPFTPKSSVVAIRRLQPAEALPQMVQRPRTKRPRNTFPVSPRGRGSQLPEQSGGSAPGSGSPAGSVAPTPAPAPVPARPAPAPAPASPAPAPAPAPAAPAPAPASPAPAPRPPAPPPPPPPPPAPVDDFDSDDSFDSSG